MLATLSPSRYPSSAPASASIDFALDMPPSMGHQSALFDSTQDPNHAAQNQSDRCATKTVEFVTCCNRPRISHSQLVTSIRLSIPNEPLSWRQPPYG